MTVADSTLTPVEPDEAQRNWCATHPIPAPLYLVLTTVATREDAQRLARAMVEQRLAACAQISAIDSVYRWNGALQSEPEWRLLFKTTKAARPALQAALRAAHPYELPAIVALPMEAEPAFAGWVNVEINGER